MSEDGDVVLTPAQRAALHGGFRNALSRSSVWPNGLVPYTFSSRFPDSYKRVVEAAVGDYAALTCVRWVPYDRRNRDHRYYVEFKQDGGCWSYIGRQMRRQPISLDRGCGHKGIAIHEMLHTLGFDHEQNRRDRDQHVRVNFDNIRRGFSDQFSLMRRMVDLQEPYDFSSVMHYGRNFFATDRRRNTIDVVEPGMSDAERRTATQRLGQRLGLSEVDVHEINKLYNCPVNTTSIALPTTTTTTTTTATTTTTTTKRPTTTTTASSATKETETPSGSKTTSTAIVAAQATKTSTAAQKTSSAAPCVDTASPAVCRRGVGLSRDYCGDPHFGLVMCRRWCGKCGSLAGGWASAGECADDAAWARQCASPSYRQGCTRTALIERAQSNWLRWRSRCRRTCGFCRPPGGVTPGPTQAPSAGAQGSQAAGGAGAECADEAGAACAAPTACRTAWWGGRRENCRKTCALC